MWIFTKWQYFQSHLLRFDKKIAQKLITYGLKGHLGSIFQYLNYRFDMYIVALFLSATQVGIYSVAVGFSEMLWMIPNALGVVITHRAASRPWAEANRITASVNRLTMAIMAMSCILWVFIGKYIIPFLYGTAFIGAVNAMLWLLPGIWFLALWKNLLNDICSRGYPLLKTYSSGIAAIATIIFDLLLIPKMGINGAALASSIAYAIGAIMSLLYFCKLTKLKMIDLFLLKKSDVISTISSLIKTVQIAD
jgi:O-antigen/teichoic acid export membrane protein